MIKLIYKEDAYNYKNVGGQPYDIKTEIILNKDADLTQVIAAFIKLLHIAGYRCATEEKMKKALQEYYDTGFYH